MTNHVPISKHHVLKRSSVVTATENPCHNIREPWPYARESREWGVNPRWGALLQYNHERRGWFDGQGMVRKRGVGRPAVGVRGDLATASREAESEVDSNVGLRLHWA
jgi:hypothetical protein